MTKIIVIGNEKGGSGKTTTCMHLIVSLLTLGFSVGSLDLDIRQQSLTRYLSNREKSKSSRPDLLMPQHRIINANCSEDELEALFLKQIEELSVNDFIVVDTPGSDSILSRRAHWNADIVITPINDSFIDLDLIGVINSETLDSIKPGVYSEVIWESKMKRAASKKSELEWFVVRNRLSTLDAINKRNVEASLQKLSKRFGFKIAPGFGDRVIFKELFLNGMTLHDVIGSGIKLTTSIIAARQELRDFVLALGVKDLVDQQHKNQLNKAA